jgi:hypothetical protein
VTTSLKSGGPVTSLATLDAKTYDLKVDASGLYWVESDPGSSGVFTLPR